MLQQNINSASHHPIEQRWIKEWFLAVIHSFECNGATELSPYRNYEINYEFEQPMEYVNRIVFHGRKHVTLIAQKITVEYITTKGIFNGLPTIKIIRKNKARKPVLIYG